MYNQPLTPSNYSDSEDESPQSNSTGQIPNYMRYPTPSAISGETSNDTADTDNSDSYVQFQNVQFTNFSLDHIAGLKSEPQKDTFYNPYSYQMQYHQQMANNNSNNSYDTYQQGLNNELVQPYSIANFNFNYQPKSEQLPEKPESPQDELSAHSPAEYEEHSGENKADRMAEVKREARANAKPKAEASDYLMRPPDSESIAAAAATAKKNRSKRRTRIKFDKEQLDLLEAAFQRTHYPDVNIVDRLSEVLSITTDKISIWFQNRRAKHKRTKKPCGEVSTILRESENPLDFIEAARKKMQMKSAAAEDLDSSTDTTRDNKSPDMDGQRGKVPPLNTSDQTAADDEDSNDQFGGNSTEPQSSFYAVDRAGDYPSLAVAKEENQAYQAMTQNMQYPPGHMAPSFPDQHFFQQPPTFHSNHFYQVSAENKVKLPSNSDSEDQQRQQQPSRSSLSSVSSSTDSRSGSPQSDSSENPEQSENASNSSSENHQDYNQSDSANYSESQIHLPAQQQYAECFEPNPYPYLQPNLPRPIYQQHGFVSHENMYQQFLSQQMPHAPSTGFTQIFQPYADCTKTPATSDQGVEHANSFMPNIAHMSNIYYQQYYNQ